MRCTSSALYIAGIDYPGDNLLRGIIYIVTVLAHACERFDLIGTRIVTLCAKQLMSYY